jgi:hypothetical protein
MKRQLQGLALAIETCRMCAMVRWLPSKFEMLTGRRGVRPCRRVCVCHDEYSCIASLQHWREYLREWAHVLVWARLESMGPCEHHSHTMQLHIHTNCRGACTEYGTPLECKPRVQSILRGGWSARKMSERCRGWCREKWGLRGAQNQTTSRMDAVHGHAIVQRKNCMAKLCLWWCCNSRFHQRWRCRLTVCIARKHRKCGECDRGHSHTAAKAHACDGTRPNSAKSIEKLLT